MGGVATKVPKTRVEPLVAAHAPVPPGTVLGT